MADATDIANNYFTVQFALEFNQRVYYIIQYIGSVPTKASVYNGHGYIDRTINDHTFIHIFGIGN